MTKENLLHLNTQHFYYKDEVHASRRNLPLVVGAVVEGTGAGAGELPAQLTFNVPAENTL